MMNKKQVIIFVSFVIVLATGLLGIHGQEKKVELKDKRITIQMVKKPLFDVFIRLIYRYDVAIGFEESTLDKDHNDYHFQTQIPTPDDQEKYYTDEGIDYSDVKNHLITVNFKNAKLEDVLNAIVKQMQNYDWEINNGVVNIFPIKGRDPRFEKLLNLRIREFGVPKGSEVGLIQPLIVLNLPEFKAFLAENNLYAESDRDDPWYIERPLPVEMKFSNLTFKELLNEITKSKRGGWILKTDKRKTTENRGKEVIALWI